MKLATIIAWASAIGFAVSVRATDDPSQGRCYRANNQRTGVFPASSMRQAGKLKWKFATKAPIRSSPVAVDGKVYVGSDDGHIYAIETGTGVLAWSLDTRAPVSGSVAVDGGVVYFCSENGNAYALDASNGKPIWVVELEKKQQSASSPAVNNGIVYFGTGSASGTVRIASGGGFFVGLDTRTGKRVWAAETAGPQAFESPVLAAGVMLGTHGRESVAAFDLTTGKVRWKESRDYGNGFITSPASQGVFFATGSLSGSIVARDVATGKLKWRSFVDAEQGHLPGGGLPGNEILSAPAVTQGSIYFGSNNGRFYCWNAADGKPVWSLPCGDQVQSAPAVAGDTVYFGCHDGRIRAVDTSTGKELWSYRTGARITSSPWPGEQLLLVASEDGVVYALQ